MQITLPYNYTPRDYQLSFLGSMRTQQHPKGTKRAVCVWHRRAGKDKTFLNYMIPRMVERIGAYYYYFPTASMGRDILWDGMDRDGFKFLDHFPKDLVARTNTTEMLIELTNGSIFKIRGTDKREPIGVNPVGCVFSEYSRQSPGAGWDLVRPILAENDGWAVFNFTPRGKNHAYRLYRMAQENESWFCEVLRADETGAISKEAIEDERLSGMSEEMVQQEFYCSFDAGVEGSYYGRTMSQLWEKGQICNLPFEDRSSVYTAWDMGIGDSTAIWFFQIIGKEVRVIDYYESYGEGIGHYADVLKSKPYNYAEHYFPHDAQKREFQKDGTVLSIADIARKLLQNVDPDTGRAWPPIKIISPHRVEQGIEEVRHLLQQDRRVWFDKVNCEHGIDCLEGYHKAYKDKLETFADTPEHDWSSHGADAFRYLTVAIKYHIKVGGEYIGQTKPYVEASSRQSSYPQNPVESYLSGNN